MESCFISCSCGSRQAVHKMQRVNNKLVCQKCYKIEMTKQKRNAKRENRCQVIVVLLDGTRLLYQPMGVNA